MPSTNPDRVTFTNCCTKCAFLDRWAGRSDAWGSEAEVGVPEALVGHKRAGLGGDDDLAAVEHDADVGHRQGAAGLMLDEELREHLAVDQLAQQPEDLRD